jgi:hypothetical protein
MISGPIHPTRRKRDRKEYGFFLLAALQWKLSRVQRIWLPASSHNSGVGRRNICVAAAGCGMGSMTLTVKREKESSTSVKSRLWTLCCFYIRK